MALFVSEAIFLRGVAFGESDIVVHLLTPTSGRVTAIAKGARRSTKRFPGTLDLFNHLRVQIDRRKRNSMPRLEQAVLLSAFLPIRRQPARFALACYLSEMLDRLAPEGGIAADMRRLFGFSLQALHAIEEGEPDAGLRLWLELRALDALGLRPELRSCVRCGRPPDAVPGPVAFHVAEGDVLCGVCSQRGEGALRVNLGTVRALERTLDFELEMRARLRLSESALAEAAHVVARFKRFHVGVELRSERVLEGLLAPSAGLPAP